MAHVGVRSDLFIARRTDANKRPDDVLTCIATVVGRRATLIHIYTQTTHTELVYTEAVYIQRPCVHMHTA